MAIGLITFLMLFILIRRCKKWDNEAQSLRRRAYHEPRRRFNRRKIFPQMPEFPVEQQALRSVQII